MLQALLALGSNLGDARANLERAIEELDCAEGLSLEDTSSLHTTQPLGGPAGQGVFANAAAIVATNLSPAELLAALQSIEQALGRQRTERWTSRPLDLDLLLYGEQVVRLPAPMVPHPRMSFRPFVLDPAVEIAIAWRHPLLGATLGELHDRLHHGDDSIVIYGGSEADRRWHTDWLCERFSGLTITEDSDQQTLIALGPGAARDQPRLAIQLLTANEAPRLGVPTLSIPATGRDDIVFDTEAAICAVWPDLCRQRAGE